MVDVIGRAKVIVEADVDRQQVQASGSKIGGILGSTLKGAAIGAGAGMAAILGTALTKGFSRLTSIENAEAKLKGLGNSAKTVSQVMDDALASVKGTAFGLGDAASVAASAVASGIKPGKELERTLKLVGDAATIAGIPLDEMGAIFNKVAATGKIQGEVIAQLGERGIPIIQLLAEQLDVTAAEVVELASDGKINFATFQKAIEDGMGGAALESGKTFEGALANAGAALGRFGAALLGPSFKDGPDVFQAITKKLDEMEPAARKAGQKIGELGDKIGKFQKSKDWKAIQADMGKFGRDILVIAGGFGDLIVQFDKLTKYATGKGALRTITDALKNLAEQYAPIAKIADAINLISKAIDKLNGKKTPKVIAPGNSVSQPLETRAGGGSVRGLALVGENGPELAQFSGSGGYVYNNSQTREMLGTSGGDVINNWNFYGPESLSKARRDEQWARTTGTRFGAATTAGV